MKQSESATQLKLEDAIPSGDAKQEVEPDAEPDAEQDALRAATERAERAERELAEIKGRMAERTTAVEAMAEREDSGEDLPGGVEALRRDDMMAHLLEALEAGKDIGHYGRLVFAMVAHHFLPEDEVLEWLAKDRDFPEEEARAMLRQVESRDYNPPRRERIVEWHGQQGFPILPNPEDPDCGNVYRSLKFPPKVYEHIEDYQEQKIEAQG